MFVGLETPWQYSNHFKVNNDFSCLEQLKKYPLTLYRLIHQVVDGHFQFIDLDRNDVHDVLTIYNVDMYRNFIFVRQKNEDNDQNGDKDDDEDDCDDDGNVDNSDYDDDDDDDVDKYDDIGIIQK